MVNLIFCFAVCVGASQSVRLYAKLECAYVLKNISIVVGKDVFRVTCSIHPSYALIILTRLLCHVLVRLIPWWSGFGEALAMLVGFPANQSEGFGQ
jgi:hypothetical protein